MSQKEGDNDNNLIYGGAGNDFLSGNEHWSKGLIKKNILQYN